MAIVASTMAGCSHQEPSLDDLALDYVFHRAKVLACAREGNTKEAEQHRRYMRAFEHDLFSSGRFTDAEAVEAVHDAELTIRISEC